MLRFVLCLLWVPALLPAIQHTGSVRAADQFIPGVTVTARQGGAKVEAFTDEAGRYTLYLTPGTWDLEVTMFGFRAKSQRLVVTNEPTVIEWTIEMPRRGEVVTIPTVSATHSPTEAPKPAATAPAA
ncbi:MAG TPA: carboxypeptidase-like regulatory domain-containing protein, partial [Candidatus Acidoferrum sp.]|nr:carboxypeptidase-like regulatory domain-containing protein [Candidatus Acidoferrum sp.]